MAEQPNNKVNIALAKVGMNKDSHPSQLDEKDYTHAFNANVETESGNSLNITNEKSNILITRYKPGFVVHGFENDILSNDTYVFLINPSNGIGEFGVIKDNQNITNLDDINVNCNGDCDKARELAQPLEELDPTLLSPTPNVYQTLISDEEALDGATNICYNYLHPQYTNLNLGFNFNTNYPIKKLSIKSEKCGKSIYFTDNLNPPRHINIENIGQYYVQNVPCAQDLSTSCIDYDELRVFKLYHIPKLKPTSIQLGGRLKMGMYEFLLAYCDASGNEISPYYSITRPISVFDKNNLIQEQQNMADRTNFSIKLEVSELDKRYSHYKVVVMQTADLDGATRYFEEGIHTINDTTVIYGSEQDKKATSIDKLLIDHLKVEKTEGLTASNNILFQYGITLKKEINLQPVVNLMGQFLRWQTHIAPESLYENGVIGAEYVGYNRDEVVPFGIRFLLDGGYETAIFPFIGRTPKTKDLDLLVENIDGVPTANNLDDTGNDVQSILDNVLDCNTTDRIKRWQYYNTADIDPSPVCQLADVEYVEVDDTITKVCIKNEIAVIPAGGFSIETDDDTYTSLSEYIDFHKAECDNAFFNQFGVPTSLCSYLEETQYDSIDCDSDVFGDMLDEEGNPMCETPTVETEIILSDIYHIKKDSLGNPILDSGGAVIYELGAIEEKVQKVFPSEYLIMPQPKNCNLYKLNTADGKFLLDGLAPLGYICNELFDRDPFPVYVRDSTFDNEDCNASEDIVTSLYGSPNNNASFFNNYYWTFRGTPTAVGTILLYTNKSSTNYIHPQNNLAAFYPQLSKNALWFDGNTEADSRFIIDISKQKDVPGDDNISTGTYVRMTLYKKCSDTTHLYAALVDLTSGGIFLFEKVNNTDLKITDSAGTATTIINGWPFNKKFLIAIDTAIAPVTVETETNCLNSTLQDRWINSPTDGCYTITKRSIEYSRVDISWDRMTLDKKFIYTAICHFQEPIVQACRAIPFKKGNFAFWESEQTYPDNTELFDSSKLKVDPNKIPINIRGEFENTFTNGLLTPDEYIFKQESWLGGTKAVVDYTCRNIRHFKFPDNRVAPFMHNRQKAPFGESIVYPLGVTINEEVIKAFLDIAVDNGLLSDLDRKRVTKYEIFRGDISLERSIVASGMLFDMRRYIEKNKQIFYPNYPYNTYSPDTLNGDSITTTESIVSNGVGYPGAEWGVSNRNYTFNSPETDYGKPTLPSELSVQSYMFGTSRGHFDEVRQHPKWVLLTDRAYNLAGTLATLEIIGEILIKAAEITSNAQVWGMGGMVFGVSLGLPAFISAGVVTVFGAAAGIVYKYGQYKYQWLKIIRDLGRPNNFSSYYFSEGFYNYIDNTTYIGNQLRGLNIAKYLNDGRFTVTNEVTREILSINNIDRERAVFLSTGKNVLRYPASGYKFYDKAPSDSSLTTMSLSGLNESGRSSEVVKNIASPYAALKNYLPSQYGSINSVKWFTTTYVGDLSPLPSSCIELLPIFGGDTYISRHNLKRKMPLFLVTAMKQADLTPFNYYYYSNIGRNPTYYISYEINKTFDQSGKTFPTIDSDLVTDNTTQSGYYYVPPTKFYLYYYGVPSFLTETRINTNYRYAGKEKRESYHPISGDLGDWTQETIVSIREPNVFKYNTVYSKSSSYIRSRTLKTTYNKAFDECIQDMPNGIMASLPDNTENSIYDPWLIYRPLDTFEFPSNYGKLKDIIDAERQSIITRFANTTVIYNRVDSKIDMGSAATATSLGGNMFFQNRPDSLPNTGLGYGGTQNFAKISNEAGHFWVDAKRGQVLMLPPGSADVKEISSQIGNKPSGMRNWFKEHLPFKILKTIPNADIDNPYHGVGIVMGWDSRYRRVLITKKDYLPSPCIEFIQGVGYVYNESRCCDEETTTNCPSDYTYNSQTGLCERVNRVLATCTVESTSRCYQVYSSIERYWETGVYTFQLNNLILNGIEYSTGQTLIINAPTGLVVGLGLDGITTYVQNISNWLSNILGVSGTGFVFYDDLSTIDCPTPSSTFFIKITRTSTLNSTPMYYWHTKNLGMSISTTTTQPTNGYGAYVCQPIQEET